MKLIKNTNKLAKYGKNLGVIWI